ncbi:hypothetical protein C8R46DRAFT_1227901 [Mycena filopes]|nr:hypothetical protein C8R46DRAFT_1227901 [Mycena filopes]
MTSSSALGPLSSRAPVYQHQYTLVNKDGRLRFAPMGRRILALPPEILAEIFIHCLSTEEDEVFPITPDPGTAPLLLCGICRQFRAIALTTPSLWSSLFMYSEHVYSESAADYVEFCRRWISRAGATPVSLCFEAFVDCDSVRSLLALISGLWRQWRDVEIVIDDSLQQFVVLPTHGEYPFLERLSISRSPEHPFVSFYNAPRLRDLRVSIYTAPVSVQWHQIIAFVTRDIEVAPWLEILQRTPDLVRGDFAIWAHNLPSTIICLHHLRSLALELPYSPHIGPRMVLLPLLNCLKAPTLEKLSLGTSYICDDTAVDVSPFLSFVSHSSSRLHSLGLYLIPTTADALIECLKAVPSLVRLVLQIRPSPDYTTALLQQLTQPDDDFLPKLENLHIFFSNRRSDEVPISAPAVVEMLRRRWAATTRLQLFRLLHSYDVSLFETAIKVDPEYRRLKQEGMVLYVGERHYISLSVV